MFKLKPTLAAFGLIATLAAPVGAQNLFAPAATVNDSVVTEFEVQQRIRFLQVLNARGATRKAAVESLINERLRGEAIRDAGLNLSQEGINAALEEFAGRANMTRAEFTSALARAGVEKETYRDFVLNGITWRDLIRARYGSRVSISEAEIDRALASQSTGASNIRVLVSEIIIPAPPPRAAQVAAIAEDIAQSTSANQFSAFARKYSATATRGAGGRLPWQDLSNLPPALQPLILSLSPGEVTQPLNIPNAVALFQLRDIEETSRPARTYSAIEYAAYYMAGGRSAETLQQAENLKAEVDVCDDLYAFAKGQPESVLDRETLPPSKLPKDFAIELSKMDEGEVSTALTRSDGQALVFLMMCGRTAEQNAEVSREDVAGSIRQRRLSGFADSLLSELRSEARISIK
ncbi:peptidylprolyl isomerase [Sulfitobacter donghicola]|uniref:Parvulin-like PPIase n=1 Tax=Sulfitobacter donghicola DSW-25 = KCTC 12864 = JCM 14565 TaxID=1300350 RepID=A0A073IJB9_9RHOB|nr:peptidylprolyl isomerase [Sulfitobacter donghicola]KEJ89591.1 peptidylprolyl isomerase [Sulfitobacter donghicola DSW-25 = KCTC 12864 = JCM 14565]KIN69428.1 Peptidyl-prolyl cis-trans isomerase SurA [Sulfitobacter donghicola DSW-25 = KCTC 12864 = JCM 14565]